MRVSRVVVLVLAMAVQQWQAGHAFQELGLAAAPLIAAATPSRNRDNDVPAAATESDEGGVNHVPCRPRETVVPLLSEVDQSELLVPDLALVKRCGGYCGLAVACVPDKTRFVKRRVKVVNLINQKASRVRTFRVEQHETCKCGCKVQASQCTADQRFEPQRCRCVCRAPRQECRAPQVWHPDTCRCACPGLAPACGSNVVFDQENCRCTAKKKRKTRA